MFSTIRVRQLCPQRYGKKGGKAFRCRGMLVQRAVDFRTFSLLLITDFVFTRLFPLRTATIFDPSCSQRASTGGACWRSGVWRLRMSLANSSPGASGDIARPNYMGPSGNGLVGADERGRKPAESRAAKSCPCPFPEGGPEV